MPPFVRAVLLINTIFYLLQQNFYYEMMAWFALWPDLSILLTHPWQILSYSVLHGDFTHLLFNMFAVWMFGSRIEMVWGPRRTAITYLSAIVFGAIAQMLVGEILSINGAPIIGASAGVFGILLAYASNAIIREIAHEDVAWRWMLGVMAVPAVFFLLFLMAVPETPRWLFAHRREDEARAISARLTNSAEESEEQMKEIADQLAEDRAAGHVPFFTRRYRKVILMAFCIAMFNQLSGINAILYYAPKVMKLAGGEAIFGAAFPYIASVVVGLMNLIATMAALTVIDKLGRRQLMIVGSIGYLVSLGFLAGMMFAYEAGAVTGSAAVWLVLIGLLGFIASHAFGQGSVIWVFISEIFPNRVRARGQSLGSLTHWTFAFITTYAFPVLTDKLGGGFAFGIFFLCMVGQLFWVLKVMPETKGIPLEEMEEKLGLSDD